MRLRRDESGASLVVVVLFLPVLILFAALAVDTANWFVHKRHLQTQADAGALAAARDLQFPCGSTATSPPNPQIIATAHKYDGTAVGAYNAQVGSPPPTAGASYSAASNNVFSLVNAKDFINQPNNPNDTDVTGDPCRDKAIDLKLSETNVPWFFKLAGVDYINAQARVSIRNLAATAGQLPLGVPSPTPEKVQATLIDESDGSTIGLPFTMTASDSTHQSWTSAQIPVTFPSTARDQVGVRVALGGGSTVTCGMPTVDCYDPGASLNQPNIPTKGVTFMRTWSGDGTPGVIASGGTKPDPPQIRDVQVVPYNGATGTPCSDGYFSSIGVACQVQLTASMLFGAGVTCSQAGLTLTAASGATPATPTMSCPAGGASGTWTSAPITVQPNVGPVSFTLKWTLMTGDVPVGATGGNKQNACTSGKPCTVDPIEVQRIFTGSPDLAGANASRSGPIRVVTVTEGATELNSLRRCGAGFTGCTHNLVITVNTYGLSDAGSIGSPAVKLRLDSPQGNFALDCGQGNGSSAFTTVMTSGCPTAFATTTGDPSACNPPSNPPFCVSPNPGGGKRVEPGLDQRINGGPTCTHRNYWVSPNTIPQILNAAPQDPRLVKVFVVPTGSFQANGSSSDIPVRAIADFYITGWNGSPCTTDGPSATPPYARDDAAATGEVIGHFVKYVESDVGGGTEGSGACDLNSINGCIAVLTK